METLDTTSAVRAPWQRIALPSRRDRIGQLWP